MIVTLENRFNQLFVYLKSITVAKRILYVLIFNLAFVFSFSLFIQKLTSYSLDDGFLKSFNIYEDFLISVILAPVVETIIFQHFIVQLLLPKIRMMYVCVLSAIAFALVHYYDVYYIICMFPPGLAFALVYCCTGGGKKGIIITAVAHSLYNLIVMVSERLF